MVPSEKSNNCAVTVSHNGVEKEVTVNLHAAVQAALQHAIQAFSGLQNPHLHSLFTEGGAELVDNQSLRDQGVECGALLLLRPGAVKGG